MQVRPIQQFRYYNNPQSPSNISPKQNKKDVPVAFGVKKDTIIKTAKDVALGMASVVVLPWLFCGPALLTTWYDDYKDDKMWARKAEISKRVGEAAGDEPFSLVYLSNLIHSAIDNEPMFNKEKYWDEQVPILKEKAVTQYAEAKAAIRKRVREQQKAEYEHKMYVKEVIDTEEELQDFFEESKRAEQEFKRQNPNKKSFATYILDYADCSGVPSGIITQVKRIPIEKNAKKVQVGSQTVARNVPSGVQTRFGVDLLRTEYKTVPVYKTVYPDDIVSFAYNNEELNRIEIHCYKK